MIPGLKPLAIEPLATYLPPPAEVVIDYNALTDNGIAELVTLVLIKPFQKASSE